MFNFDAVFKHVQTSDDAIAVAKSLIAKNNATLNVAIIEEFLNSNISNAKGVFLTAGICNVKRSYSDVNADIDNFIKENEQHYRAAVTNHIAGVNPGQVKNQINQQLAQWENASFVMFFVLSSFDMTHISFSEAASIAGSHQELPNFESNVSSKEETKPIGFIADAMVLSKTSTARSTIEDFLFKHGFIAEWDELGSSIAQHVPDTMVPRIVVYGLCDAGRPNDSILADIISRTAQNAGELGAPFRDKIHITTTKVNRLVKSFINWKRSPVIFCIVIGPNDSCTGFSIPAFPSTKEIPTMENTAMPPKYKMTLCAMLADAIDKPMDLLRQFPLNVQARESIMSLPSFQQFVHLSPPQWASHYSFIYIPVGTSDKEINREFDKWLKNAPSSFSTSIQYGSNLLIQRSLNPVADFVAVVARGRDGSLRHWTNVGGNGQFPASSGYNPDAPMGYVPPPANPFYTNRNGYQSRVADMYPPLNFSTPLPTGDIVRDERAFSTDNYFIDAGKTLNLDPDIEFISFRRPPINLKKKRPVMDDAGDVLNTPPTGSINAAKVELTVLDTEALHQRGITTDQAQLNIDVCIRPTSSIYVKITPDQPTAEAVEAGHVSVIDVNLDTIANYLDSGMDIRYPYCSVIVEILIKRDLRGSFALNLSDDFSLLGITDPFVHKNTVRVLVEK